MHERLRVGKALIPGLIVALLALALRLGSAETANVSYLVLAAYALLGRGQSVQALTLSWLFSVISPGIAPDGGTASAARYLIIASAVLCVFLRSSLVHGSFKIDRLVFFTLLIGVFIGIHSALFSPLLDISLLKALSWCVTLAALFASWAGMDYRARSTAEAFVFGSLMIVVLASLPLLSADLGYLRNDMGFQGILNHPQVFGPVTALLGAYLGGRILLQPRPRAREVLLLGICFVLVILSESRTAGAALVLGIAIPLAYVLLFRLGGHGSALAKQIIRRTASVTIAALVAILVAGPFLADQARNYLLKRNEASGVLEAAELSRGLLIYQMLENVEEKPLTGIGFGLASDLASMDVERDSLFGLPTGAAVEKGVMPIAILEELGLPGFILVGIWLCALVGRAARGGLLPLAVLATALLTNLGEATFFSTGGMGLLILILTSWAATARADTSVFGTQGKRVLWNAVGAVR